MGFHAFIELGSQEPVAMVAWAPGVPERLLGSDLNNGSVTESQSKPAGHRYKEGFSSQA